MEVWVFVGVCYGFGVKYWMFGVVFFIVWCVFVVYEYRIEIDIGELGINVSVDGCCFV